MRELWDRAQRSMSEAAAGYERQSHAALLARQVDDARELAVRADEMRRAMSILDTAYRKLKEN